MNSKSFVARFSRCTTVIPALNSWKQEDQRKFKIILSYIVNSRVAWATRDSLKYAHIHTSEDVTELIVFD